MSSISAKISIIPKASPEHVPQLLDSISESMGSSALSQNEMDQLCKAIIPLLSSKNPPAVIRAAFSMTEKIVKSNFPKSFPIDVLNILKTSLEHSKKNVRNDALNLANNLIGIVTPTVFWDVLGITLIDKNPYLKESSLILFHQTVQNFPDFKTAKYIKNVFACLQDQQKISRHHAFNIAKEMHSRNPESVENLLKKQFSIKANDIINMLKDTTPNVSGSTNTSKKGGSYADAIVAPQLNSNEEIEEGIIKEFDTLCPEIQPNSSQCPFQALEMKLKRSADWQDRMEALRQLVSHARGTSKPKDFVRDIRLIQDQFIDCLTDARSALCKFSMICLIAMAEKFGRLLDQSSELLIPPVLTRTTHGTFVIAKSSELAVIRYVQLVQGKRIKNILIGNVDHAAVEVKVAVVKAMIVAKNYWTPKMSKEFNNILMQKQHDSSQEVRQLVTDLDLSKFEPVETETETETEVDVIPSEQESETFSQPSKSSKSSKQTQQQQQQQTQFPRPPILEPLEPLEPLKPSKSSKSLEIMNANNDKQENPDVGNAEEILKNIYENRDTRGLAEFLNNHKPGMAGYMQDAIDLVVMDLNEEEGVEAATLLLKVLCDNYLNFLYPYIPQILLDLPEDDTYGAECIKYLANAIGELPLAKLLRQSKLSYTNGYILNVAQNMPNDIDFQTFAVLNSIANGHYDRFHLQIFLIIKNINDTDPIKCEGLFASMSQKDRNEILDEFHDQLPTIFRAFNEDQRDDLPSKLVNEITKAKNGEKIDFDIISEVSPVDTNLLLLAIAAIRESTEFDPRFVEYLIRLTDNKEPAIIGAVTNAFQKRCETDPHCCILIADSFIPTHAAFKLFGRSIQYSDRGEAKQALMQIKEKAMKGLDDVNTKYAVFSILAKASIYLGEEYQNFCGQLSPANYRLLRQMIEYDSVHK